MMLLKVGVNLQIFGNRIRPFANQTKESNFFRCRHHRLLVQHHRHRLYLELLHLQRRLLHQQQL